MQYCQYSAIIIFPCNRAKSAMIKNDKEQWQLSQTVIYVTNVLFYPFCHQEW